MTTNMTDEKLDLVVAELAKITAVLEDLAPAVHYLQEMKIEEHELEQRRQREMFRRHLTTRPPYPAKNRMDYTDFPDVRVRAAKPRDLSTDHND